MRIVLLAAVVAVAGCSHEEVANEPDVQLKDTTSPVYTSADSFDDVSAHDPDDIVVDFRDGVTKEQIDAYEKDWGIDLEYADAEEGPDSAITVAHVDEGRQAALLELIRQNPDVEAAEPDMVFSVPAGEGASEALPTTAPAKDSEGFQPNDPQYGKQWNLPMINMPKAWQITKGKGVVVAVLDTGIAYEDYEDFKQVPDLNGAKFAKGYDFVNNDSHPNDDHGHGTHVAGTIAQVTNNKEGVAGVAFEATLMPVKVLNHFGSGSTAQISDAIRWAADHGANVINMSLGGGGRSAVMENAVAYARKKGVVVVCAAGNGGRGVVEFPAAYPGSVAVVAVGPTGAKAAYSSWGKEADVSAPGGDKSRGVEFGILQNTIDAQDNAKSIYAYFNGTSMAAPHVAGLAALLFSAGAKTPDQVEKALFASAKAAPGQQGWSEQFGHGIIDAQAALKAVKKLDANGDLLVAEGPVAVTPAAVETYEVVTPLGTGFFDIDWKPFMWAAGFLAFVLLTLGKKERPGYLNIIFKPGFAVPLVLTTVGVFFARWLGDPSSATVQALVLPIPDWLQKIIFGRGSLANPIVYSAAIPIVASFFAIKWKGLRPVIGGLSIGFAGILGYTIWAKAPALAWLPFTFLAIPWLAANALVCLFIARAMLKKEKA
ncbi:MAG: S8 family serine peptidase [Myxococcaceae bacterium]|nr:S8 family serine peptidase [Myxococcaceae bacterium]